MSLAEYRRFRLTSKRRGNRRAHRAALAAAAGSLFCSAAWCQTLLWNNSFGGDIQQAFRWTPNMVPTAANNAVFNLNATYTVTNPSLLPIEAALLQVRSGTVFFDEVLWQTDAVEIGPLTGDNAYVQFNGFSGPSFMGVGIAERTGFAPPTVLVGGAGIGSMYYDGITSGTFSASSLTIGAAASGKGIVQLNNFLSSVSGDVIVGDAGDGFLYTYYTTVGGHLHIGKSAGGVGTAHFGGTATSVSIAPAVGATGTLYGGDFGAASFEFAYVGGSASGAGGAGTLATAHPLAGIGGVHAQTLRLYNTGTVVLNEGGTLSYETLVHDPNPNVVFGTGWTLEVTSFAPDALKIGSGQFIPASFNMPALSQIGVIGGVQLLSGGSFNLGTGGLGSGTLSLESNARFNVSGGALGAGALSMQPGSTLSLSSGNISTTTLTLNGGQINITGGGLTANRILTTSPVPGVFTGGTLALSAAIPDALRIGTGEVFGNNLNIVAGQGLNNSGETHVLGGSTLNIAGGTFRTGTLTIDTGGTVTWSSGTFGASFVVDDHGLFGNTLALTSTRKLNNAGTVIVGQTGAGTITLDTSSQASAQRFILGEQPGSAGTITIASGASTSYTFGGNTVVGGQGTGYLSLPASSSQGLGVLYVGDGAGSHGTVILNGVTASIGVNSSIGGGTFYAGSGQGTLSITNSTINFTGQLQIHDGGRVFLSGGTLSGPAITRIDDNGDSVFGGQLQFNSGSILLSAGDLVVGTGGFLGPNVTLVAGQNIRTAAAVRIDPGNTLTLDGGFLQTRDLLLNAPPTGTLAFNRGTLAFSNGLLLDSIAPSTPVIGSTLTLNDPGQRLIGTGGTLSVGGAGLGTLSISNGAAGTFSGRITIGGVTGGTGLVSVGGGTGDSLLATTNSGTLIVGSPGTGTLNVLSGGTVSTSGTLQIGANGRVNLSGGRLAVGTLVSPTGGINWNAGTLAIGAGTVLIGSGTPLGNNLVIDSDMALEINATQNPNLRIGGTAGSAGAITVQSGGRLGSGSMVIGGINPGTLTIDAGGTFVGSQRRITVENNGTLSFNGARVGPSGSIIVNPGGHMFSGALPMSDPDNLENAGTVTVTANELRVRGGPSVGTFNINAGARLTWWSAGALTSTSRIVGSGTLGLATDYFGTGSVLVQGQHPGFTGRININAGTMSLSSSTVNTAFPDSPQINIAAGTLNVSGVSAPGGFQVPSGQTISGAGRILGAATFLTGSTLAPGNSIGTLSTGSVTLATGSVLQTEIDFSGNSADQLQVTGTVNLNGSGGAPGLGAILQFSFVGGTVPTSPVQSFVIVRNDQVDAVAGTFDGIADDTPVTILSGLLQFVVDYNSSNVGLGTDGNDITVTFTAVPEPTAIWILPLIGIACRRRRRPS